MKHGTRYGKAGNALTGSDVQSKYGKHALAGAYGERYLSRAIENSYHLSSYTMWQSLRIPNAPGRTRYDSDVDFALASNNRVVLIDCKMWAAGNIYWTFLNRPMKGLAPMKNSMSRNMELAVNRYTQSLPGCLVTGMVIFAPVKNGRLPSSVMFLRWPGGIRSYLPQDGFRKASKFLGEQMVPTPQVQSLLGNMTR